MNTKESKNIYLYSDFHCRPKVRFFDTRDFDISRMVKPYVVKLMRFFLGGGTDLQRIDVYNKMEFFWGFFC